MSRINPPGVVEVYFGIGAIADYTAPTSAELNALTDVTGDCRGVPSIPDTGNTADSSDLSSKFNKRNAASHGGDDLSLDLYRDDTTDTSYDLLLRGSSGHFAVAWDGIATPGTWAIGDNAWVYPVEIISRGMGVPGRDEDEFFTCLAAIFDDPAEKFPLAA